MIGGHFVAVVPVDELHIEMVRKPVSTLGFQRLLHLAHHLFLGPGRQKSQNPLERRLSRRHCRPVPGLQCSERDGHRVVIRIVERVPPGFRQQPPVISLQNLNCPHGLLQRAYRAPRLAAVACPSVYVHREPYRAADRRQDLHFGGLQHQGRIGPVVSTDKGQRSVAAALLLNHQVPDQIPFKRNPHLPEGGKRQVKHGRLSLAITRTAAENDPVFHAPIERPILVRRGRHDVQVGIHDQRPSAANSLFDHSQIRPIGVAEIRQLERIVGILLNRVRKRHQFTFVHHVFHSRVQHAHRVSFVPAHGRDTDQVAEQPDRIFLVSLDCRLQ